MLCSSAMVLSCSFQRITGTDCSFDRLTKFHFHANQSHFHKNAFALRLALKQRHKGNSDLAYCSNDISNHYSHWSVAGLTMQSEEVLAEIKHN